MKLWSINAKSSSSNGTALGVYNFEAEASGDGEEKQLAVFGKRQQLRARSSPAIPLSLARTNAPFRIAQFRLLFHRRPDMHFDGDMGRSFLVGWVQKRSYPGHPLESVN